MQPFHSEWLHASKLKFLYSPRGLETGCSEVIAAKSPFDYDRKGAPCHGVAAWAHL